jgi:hypothetical protein
MKTIIQNEDIGEISSTGPHNTCQYSNYKRSSTYSLCFKTKVTFGHNLRYETKGTFGEISLKLRQTNWNVARNHVNVVANELPSQSTNNLHLFNN